MLENLLMPFGFGREFSSASSVAIFQTNIKRMLAYSSVAQSGVHDAWA